MMYIPKYRPRPQRLRQRFYTVDESDPVSRDTTLNVTENEKSMNRKSLPSSVMVEVTAETPPVSIVPPFTAGAPVVTTATGGDDRPQVTVGNEESTNGAPAVAVETAAEKEDDERAAMLPQHDRERENIHLQHSLSEKGRGKLHRQDDIL